MSHPLDIPMTLLPEEEEKFGGSCPECGCVLSEDPMRGSQQCTCLCNEDGDCVYWEDCCGPFCEGWCRPGSLEAPE